MQFHDWPCRGRVSTEKMAPVRGLLGRQLRQRNSGSCPGSIRPGITHFSLFPYAFCASPAADPPLQPKVSVFQKVSLCAGPLRSVSEFSGFLYLTRMATSPTDFYNHILFEFLPPGLGEALRRARAPRLFRGGLRRCTLPFWSSTAMRENQASLLHTFASPNSLDVGFTLHFQIYVL